MARENMKQFVAFVYFSEAPKGGWGDLLTRKSDGATSFDSVDEALDAVRECGEGDIHHVIDIHNNEVVARGGTLSTMFVLLPRPTMF